MCDGEMGDGELLHEQIMPLHVSVPMQREKSKLGFIMVYSDQRPKYNSESVI